MTMHTSAVDNRAQTATKQRFGILTLIFISVVINYMDRINISVAASALSEDLGISTVQMGLVFSALLGPIRHYKFPAVLR